MLVRPVSGSSMGVSVGNTASLASTPKNQHAEEVVGPVDLVHLAGARIADHHRRAVDAVAQPLRRTHQRLGLEFGLVVGGRQPLAHVEVVLGVRAGEVARHGDRRHVVQRGVQPQRQVDDRAGALDVRGPLFGRPGGDVVDRRAVHDVVDLAEVLQGLLGQRQVGEFADQRPGPLTPPTSGRARSPHSAARCSKRPSDRWRTSTQTWASGRWSRDDAATDEPGTAGNDIPHAAIVRVAAAHVNRACVNLVISWRSCGCRPSRPASSP